MVCPWARITNDPEESRNEFIKPWNNGILNTVEKADVIFEQDGALPSCFLRESSLIPALQSAQPA